MRSQIKLPLHVADDAQGPMGVLDANGKAVAWFSDLFTPTKGYAWGPEKRPMPDPACPNGSTYYAERNEAVMRVYHLLNSDGWRPPSDLPRELHSSSHELKLLLIMVPHRSHATIGWYMASTQHWYEEGGCSPTDVILWQPLPELPYDPIIRKRHEPSWNHKATPKSSTRSKKAKSASKAKSA